MKKHYGNSKVKVAEEINKITNENEERYAQVYSK